VKSKLNLCFIIALCLLIIAMILDVGAKRVIISLKLQKAGV
jgi:hypothetical protein